MFYLAVYAVMDLGAFGMVATFSAGEGDRDDLADYQGLGYSHPWRAAILAACLISLAGLPPTAGFMGKLVLFRAVLDLHYYVLATIGMFTVLVSIYYYMKVVVVLYMQPQAESAVIPGTDLGGHLAGAIVLGVILWLGLAPAPLLSLIADIVAAWPKLT
jgi:NADH-quinone oxidoreductase subunit N